MALTLNELYTKRAKAWEAAKAFLDTHRNAETGCLSGEDVQMYERMENEITNLSAEIERTKKLEAFEAELKKPVNTPLMGRPGTVGAEEKTGRASHQYTVDMLAAMRTHFRTVTDVLEEGTDSAGGYLVPEEWDSRLIDKLEAENIMRGLGTVLQTTGEHKINVVGTKPAAAWIDEGESLTFVDETFGQKSIGAHKLHIAFKVTEELLYDNAYNLEGHIIDQSGKAIANAEEAAFLTGDGNGKPTGLFHATKGGEVGVTVESITSDSIIDLIYALKRPYRKNAGFILQDATLALVRKLKDDNRAYMWQPSYQAGEPDRLCGYPIYPSEYAPAASSGNSPIAFGDFSYYNIGDRGTRSMQELRELFAGQGMIGYVCKERVDGILVLQEAVKVLALS